MARNQAKDVEALRASISLVVQSDGWRGQVTAMVCAQRREDAVVLSEPELQTARDILLQLQARLAYIVAAEEERQLGAALQRRQVARGERRLKAI